MTAGLIDARAEPKAKAALIDFLRSNGAIDRHSVVTTELTMDKQAARADVVVCSRNDLHCFEIKTERDSLVRLDKQIKIYEAHADFVTVVVATRHVSAAMSRIPEYIGLYEMVAFSENELRIVREPQRSPKFDTTAILSLLPVVEIVSRLNLSGRPNRKDAVIEAGSLPDCQKKEAVISFLHDRFKSSSRTFLHNTRRRKIKPKDLSILRRSSVEKESHHSPVFLGGFSNSNFCPDQETYNHVGRSFGPVPEEVRALLAS